MLTFSTILIYYSIFSITTGIISYLSIFRPILKVLKLQGIVCHETESPVQTAVILIIVSAFFAPFLLKMALTGPSQEFVESYREKILEDI